VMGMMGMKSMKAEKGMKFNIRYLDIKSGR
jgi:hypothetical protein